MFTDELHVHIQTVLSLTDSDRDMATIQTNNIKPELVLHAGASIPIYRWRQMRHGQFWGESMKSLILSFNIRKREFCAQI